MPLQVLTSLFVFHRIEFLDVYLSGAAPGIIVLLPPSHLIAMSAIDTDSAFVLRVDMKPDLPGSSLLRGRIEVAQQFSSHTVPAVRVSDLDGLDVGENFPRFSRPFHNGKTRHPVPFFGDPGRGVCVFDQPPHIAPAKPKRGLKTLFLDRVKLGKIVREVESVEHKGTLNYKEKQKPP